MKRGSGCLRNGSSHPIFSNVKHTGLRFSLLSHRLQHKRQPVNYKESTNTEQRERITQTCTFTLQQLLMQSHQLGNIVLDNYFSIKSKDSVSSFGYYLLTDSNMHIFNCFIHLFICLPQCFLVFIQIVIHESNTTAGTYCQIIRNTSSHLCQSLYL